MAQAFQSRARLSPMAGSVRPTSNFIRTPSLRGSPEASMFPAKQRSRRRLPRLLTSRSANYLTGTVSARGKWDVNGRAPSCPPSLVDPSPTHEPLSPEVRRAMIAREVADVRGLRPADAPSWRPSPVEARTALDSYYSFDVRSLVARRATHDAQPWYRQMSQRLAAAETDDVAAPGNDDDEGDGDSLDSWRRASTGPPPRTAAAAAVHSTSRSPLRSPSASAVAARQRVRFS